MTNCSDGLAASIELCTNNHLRRTSSREQPLHIVRGIVHLHWMQPDQAPMCPRSLPMHRLEDDKVRDLPELAPILR